jgi:hypothetical protein
VLPASPRRHHRITEQVNFFLGHRTEPDGGGEILFAAKRAQSFSNLLSYDWIESWRERVKLTNISGDILWHWVRAVCPPSTALGHPVLSSDSNRGEISPQGQDESVMNQIPEHLANGSPLAIREMRTAVIKPRSSAGGKSTSHHTFNTGLF